MARAGVLERGARRAVIWWKPTHWHIELVAKGTLRRTGRSMLRPYEETARPDRRRMGDGVPSIDAGHGMPCPYGDKPASNGAIVPSIGAGHGMPCPYENILNGRSK